MNERDAYIALNMMEKVGPVGVRSLVAALGSARAIFDAPREQLLAVRGMGSETVAALLEQRGSVEWEAEQARAAEKRVRILTPLDQEYPRRLLEIHDPPLALYVFGSLQERDKHAIGVVGTRHPTHYGRETTARLSGQLARCGMTIVSGLAEGVDTAAHQAAIDAGGRTLAVLGGGLDCLYPASNRDLALRVAEQGAVMSEFPLGRRPDRTTFAIRNRIVSGLSMGLLVVEAGSKSGALITVRAALDQGRPVFAVPGRIDSPASVGTNGLIKQGAQLVTDADDVLSAFEYLAPALGRTPAPADGPRPVLTDSERRVVEALHDGPQDVDAVIRTTGLAAGDVGSLLIMLEMKKMVRLLPGRVVELAARGG